MTQDELIEGLPPHLRPFVQRQDYSRYTPRDQAVWRFVMRHLTRYLRQTAHPVYMEGLARTGIALDHIPSIEEMNVCLSLIGWRAVAVDGFIPPAIFMEFQALKVLVIALDMRQIDHIFYTPAPDILHESAGHTPFIVDVDYAEFLQRFGEVGMRAISTREDIEIYEAIRGLSILKESPDSSAAEIDAAEVVLNSLVKANNTPSEASLLTRLHWWTVEYGLVGTVEDYRIFGAGLLSSLGESRHCLDDQKVEKIPLTVDAVMTPYDITCEQPQLFVTRSCKHLSQVLEEFAAAMCFQRGGAQSLRAAIDAGSVCTAVYDSGIQVSGRVSELLCDAVGNAIYFKTRGPTQLACRDREIDGHGIDVHEEGFGSPVGMLKDFTRCLSEYTIDELGAHGIVQGDPVVLEFLSGITVSGVLRQIHRQEHRSLILGFEDCTVTHLDGRVLSDPGWGRYYMAVGARVQSVYGGTADRERYPLYKPTPRTATQPSEQDELLQALYTQVADCAKAQALDASQWQSLSATLARYPGEWLLRVELLDLLDELGEPVRAWAEQVAQELVQIRSRYPGLAAELGLAVAALPPGGRPGEAGGMASIPN